MVNPELRVHVPEWKDILYTGNVLGPPGWVACGKFSEECVREVPGPHDETRRLVKLEIQTKLEPFREMHPNSTYKHMCSLLRCKVSFKLLVILD